MKLYTSEQCFTAFGVTKACFHHVQEFKNITTWHSLTPCYEYNYYMN